MNSNWQIRGDDLSSLAVRDLLSLHLARMHATSPAGAVFALDLSGLQSEDVTVWTCWEDTQLLGIGALKTSADGTGELKSMRTHPDHLRRGVASALLDHIFEAARKRRLSRVSLETGRGSAFEPALALYRSRGFRDGDAFGAYQDNGFSQFLHFEMGQSSEASVVSGTAPSATH